MPHNLSRPRNGAFIRQILLPGSGQTALQAVAAVAVLLMVMVAPATPATAARPALEPAACPCDSAKVCTGKRGGRYCIGPSGAKRYLR